MTKSATRRSPVPNRERTRRRLQKEIGCKCPFCEKTDVENFEIHHIDSNHDNHLFSNLLLVCGACHNRFHSEPMTSTVKEMKHDLTKEFIFWDMESNGYDYVAFSMEPSNGRLPQQIPNGTKAKLTIIDRNTMILHVNEKNDRKWTGFMTIKQRTFGGMSWKYENEYEFGTKLFEISSTDRGTYFEDTVFLQPSYESKDYGRELFVRNRPRRPSVNNQTSQIR